MRCSMRLAAGLYTGCQLSYLRRCLLHASRSRSRGLTVAQAHVKLQGLAAGLRATVAQARVKLQGSRLACHPRTWAGDAHWGGCTP